MQKYINCFKKNDYSCFNEFYNLTKKQVYFTALSVLKDPSLAEDVMQETYIKFLETIDNFKNGANVYSFLTVIARNKSINIYNRNKKLDFDQDKLQNIPSEINESSSGVEEILKYLNEKEREIVVYHVILDYKFSEIAKITSEPLGTVLWRYNKAMKILKKEVNGNE